MILTTLELSILLDRLEAGDIVADCLCDDLENGETFGFPEMTADDLRTSIVNMCDEMASGGMADILGNLEEFPELAAAILADCVTGSTYLGRHLDDSRQRVAAIARAGDSLAAKVSAAIGRTVTYPQG